MQTSFTRLWIMIVLFSAPGIIPVVAQQSGSFTVGGDIDKFYPVAFYDGNWASNKPTELFLGRSDVHTNSNWRGSLNATFTFHLTDWGHGSDFVQANIYSNTYALNFDFIGGWLDVSNTNGDKRMLIWLKGGNTTYYYSSATTVDPQIYDGVSHPFPYQQTNGPTHTYKTVKDTYVNTNGYNGKSVYVNKLSVNGEIHSKKVRVTQTGWPDYVFEKSYVLPSLKEVEEFIQRHKHLPGVEPAKQIETNGLDLGNNQAVLLKKIEELTLYIIELKKTTENQQKEIEQLKRSVLPNKNN
ncbi:MAG: hypothetical protein GXC73_19290 [Chitinophagaceae bacterium]|nr:hypothetical protein [Chitinophagaceae bacterium]